MTDVTSFLLHLLLSFTHVNGYYWRMEEIIEITNDQNQLVFVISAKLYNPIILAFLESEYNCKLQAAGIGQGWVHTPSVEVPASGTPATND